MLLVQTFVEYLMSMNACVLYTDFSVHDPETSLEDVQTLGYSDYDGFF